MIKCTLIHHKVILKAIRYRLVGQKNPTPHSVPSTVPGVGQYRPAGQSWQSASSVFPSEPEYVPAGHLNRSGFNDWSLDRPQISSKYHTL